MHWSLCPLVYMSGILHSAGHVLVTEGCRSWSLETLVSWPLSTPLLVPT